MKTVIVFLLVLFAAGTALGNPPINGTYKSVTLGGQMLDGRYSESWSAANGELGVGNTTNNMSWDGATLGTQWWMYCAEIVSANLLFSTVDGAGNGMESWLVVYRNGSMVLDGNGPWGDGSVASYSATFDSYVEVKELTFVSFGMVSATSNVSLQATFVGYDQTCVNLVVANQAQFGNTDKTPPDPNYPGFLDPNTCAATRTLGSWGVSDDFTLTITGCVIPTAETSWGKVKAMYE